MLESICSVTSLGAGGQVVCAQTWAQEPDADRERLWLKLQDARRKIADLEDRLANAIRANDGMVEALGRLAAKLEAGHNAEIDQLHGLLRDVHRYVPNLRYERPKLWRDIDAALTAHAGAGKAAAPAGKETAGHDARPGQDGRP